MKVKTIAAIMIHVPDWKEGLAWYEKAFPEAKRMSYPEFEFECLDLNGIQIEIVNADEKVGVGAFGLAVDWEVESFDDAVNHLIALGATLYRGPGKLENWKIGIWKENVQTKRPIWKSDRVTRKIKRGYEVFGVLEDCSKGHKRYYLKKSL